MSHKEISDKHFRPNYKYNHLDAAELRKRNDETMLRKQKRDEQVCLLKKSFCFVFIINIFYS